LGGCKRNLTPPRGTANAASRNNAGLGGCKRNLTPPRGTANAASRNNAGLGGCKRNPVPPRGTADNGSRNNAGLKGSKRNLIPPGGTADNASRNDAGLRGCKRNPIPPGETADTASQNDAGLNGCELDFTRYSFTLQLSCTSQSYLYIAPSIYNAHAIAIPLHDCKRNPIPPRGTSNVASQNDASLTGCEGNSIMLGFGLTRLSNGAADGAIFNQRSFPGSWQARRRG